MSDEKWRVTVERSGEEPGIWDEVVTLSAPREQLARFAPGVVADALGVNTATTYTDKVPDYGFGTEADQMGALATEKSVPDGNYGPGQPAKRKRRTKAEIEADRLREQGGQRGDAVDPAERQAVADMNAAIENGGSVTRTESGAVAVDDPGPAAVFNPFAPK